MIHKVDYVYLLNRGAYDDETPGVWESRNAGFVAKIIRVENKPHRFEWEVSGPGYNENGVSYSERVQQAADAVHLRYRTERYCCESDSTCSHVQAVQVLFP